MASPQTQNGYIRIANELWDAVIMRDFSKRQFELLWFIWRLSYGCQHKTAYVPMMKSFELCGIQATKIKDELIYLEKCRVLFWDRENSIFEINKDHSQWFINPVKKFDEVEFSKLIFENLTKKSHPHENVDFPKREEVLPEKGTLEEQEIEQTSQKGNIEVPFLGSETAVQLSNDAAFEPSKDIIKDKEEEEEKEEYMTALDAYTFTFNKMSYTGHIQGYVVKLLKRGCTDSFIREVFLTMGENGLTDPNLNYMKKVAEDWIEKGISNRKQANEMKKGVNAHVETSGSTYRPSTTNTGKSRTTAISASDVDDFVTV